MNAYYTHQKTLIRILESFDYSKPVSCLEFGSGDGSSSIFHQFLNSNPNLTVQCYEHDKSWLENMTSKYKSDNYHFNHVDWNNFDYLSLKDKNYDLIFVDQGDWDARITTIDELRNNAKYIILHDYCYYNGFMAGMPQESVVNFNSIDENSFFGKYNNEFELIAETELYPPTLIFKNKKMI